MRHSQVVRQLTLTQPYASSILAGATKKSEEEHIMITLTNARQLEQALNDFILECRYGAHPCEGCKFYEVCLKLHIPNKTDPDQWAMY